MELACLALFVTQAVALPHIVFIVADDLGWNDVGFRGGDISTPNVDSLARDGLVLDQYYVQSVCSPSRATFLTGRYPIHHTVNDWLVAGQATALPLNETLLPELLDEAGYSSHAVGKWHLGFHKWAHTPTFRGFQTYLGFYTGGEDYFRHSTKNVFDLRRDFGVKCGAGCSEVAWEELGRYSTEIFTERAVELIQAHEKKAPFFLYLAYQAVHAPAQVPESYVSPYNASIADAKRRTFAGMLSCMDEGIGNVTRALQAKGMLENTLIVFTTDNGGPIDRSVGGDSVGASNFPLRGGKHSIWEGGTRGTAVVWAGQSTELLPKERRGSLVRSLMHGADWLPTFCSIAGISKACSRLPLDGVDQRGALFAGGDGPRREVLYGQHDDAPERATPYDTALRDAEGWKLVQDWGGKPDYWGNQSSPDYWGNKECLNLADSVLLFNVETDPSEYCDVSAKHPEIVARLAARLAELRSSAVDVVGGGGHPDPSCPKYDPAQHQNQHVGEIWEPWCDSDVIEI